MNRIRTCRSGRRQDTPGDLASLSIASRYQPLQAPAEQEQFLLKYLTNVRNDGNLLTFKYL